MNTMQALKFFLEVLCGTASALIAGAWLMLFLLRRKVRQRRNRREAERPSLFSEAMLTHR
jgi:hypothetical protein